MTTSPPKNAAIVSSSEQTPKCPACAKRLMSRIAKLCSWCGAPIPNSLRLSPEEIRQVHAEDAAAKEKLEALEEKRAVADGKKAIHEGVVESVVSQILKRLQ